jgi:hypothetical protein
MQSEAREGQVIEGLTAMRKRRPRLTGDMAGRSGTLPCTAR